MARALRIECAGAYYQLLSRGNARRDIFRTDADRGLFLEALGEGCEQFGSKLFPYDYKPIECTESPSDLPGEGAPLWPGGDTR